MGAASAYYTTREKAIQYLLVQVAQASDEELEELLRMFIDTSLTSPYIKDELDEDDYELNLDY